ncbi:unnamed protein product [Parajaminaea phylloscopi]
MASGSKNITFTAPAYALAALHAARHPHASVTGILLGNSEGDSSVVTRVVPLAHHWTDLVPAEDNALALLQAHLAGSTSASDNSSTRVLGIYEAPARSDASSPSASALRLAAKVARSHSAASPQSSNAHLVLLNGPGILSSSDAIKSYPITAASSGAVPTTTAPVRIEKEEQTLKALREALQTPAGRSPSAPWQEVSDFDDHLEDTAVDWLNNRSAMDAISKVLSLSVS